MNDEQKKDLQKHLSDTMLKIIDRAEKIQKIDFAKLNFTSKTKTDRRMKIYLKLDKNSTEQFNFVREVFKETISSDELMRQIFMKGLDTIAQEMKKSLEEIKAKAEELMKEEKSSEVLNGEDENAG